MEFGISLLSVIPIRIESSDKSEMASQLLFGECFRTLEIMNGWVFIESFYDNTTGDTFRNLISKKSMFSSFLYTRQFNPFSQERKKEFINNMIKCQEDAVAMNSYSVISYETILENAIGAHHAAGNIEKAFQNNTQQY